MDSVLIVEDEVPVRTLITRWVMSAGHAVALASSAAEALQQMSREAAGVVLSDIHMPGRDGLWLAGELHLVYPDTAVIIASGDGEFSTAVTSLRQGVLDYLLKPLGQAQVVDAVGRGVDWHRRQVAIRVRQDTFETELRERKRDLTQSIAEAHVNSTASLGVMLRMLTTHAPDAYDHAMRVGRGALNTAMLLGVAQPELSDIEHGALMHDLGKIAIPEAILCKPCGLEPAERKVIDTHPQLGHDMISHVPFLSGAAAIVLASHERFDGKGYPNRLAGRNIPLGARIVSIADSYDAMTHRGTYRLARSPADALQELERCSGTQFDPEVLAAFRLAMNLSGRESTAAV